MIEAAREVDTRRTGGDLHFGNLERGLQVVRSEAQVVDRLIIEIRVRQVNIHVALRILSGSAEMDSPGEHSSRGNILAVRGCQDALYRQIPQVRISGRR